jgi:hypothetical protein
MSGVCSNNWKRCQAAVKPLAEWVGARAPRIFNGDIEAVIFQPSIDSSHRVSRRALRDVAHAPPRSLGDRYPVPTRGLITHTAIPRGEVVMELPMSRIFHCPAGVAVLNEWASKCGSAAAMQSGGGSSAGNRLCKSLSDLVLTSTHLPCTESREPILLTAAVAVARQQLLLAKEGAPASSLMQRWEPYLKTLPPRIPPLGTALPSVGHHSEEVMVRRLRSGEVSTPLLGRSEPTDEDKKQLVLTQLRSGALQNTDGCVASARVEVVPTSALATGFYTGDLVLQGSGAHQRGRASVEVPAFLTHMHDMTRTLESQLLSKMANILAQWSLQEAPSGGPHEDDDDDDLCCARNGGLWMEHLVWSHFMLRSRAKYVRTHPQLSPRRSCALVPLADMINHDGVHPNVRFVEVSRRGEGDMEPGTLLVVAMRAIDANEELTSDYHDDIYYPEDTSVSNSESPSVHNRHHATMRRIEQEQRYELVRPSANGGRATSLQESLVVRPSKRFSSKTPLSHSRVADAMAKEATSYGTRGFESPEDKKRLLNRRHVMSRKETALADAEWAYRFGFVKDGVEKEAEASCLWDQGLKDRVARLTDIRRKGRPGEFVVGVPEGLHHLHAERERLQRERFAGKAIFPPQRA